MPDSPPSPSNSWWQLWRLNLVSFVHTPRALALVGRQCPGLTAAQVALTAVSAAMPVSIAFVSKIIIDTVVRGQRALGTPGAEWAHGRAVHWVLVEFALVATALVADRLLNLVRGTMNSRLGLEVSLMIMAKALRLRLRDFEDPAVYDKLTRARREASARPQSLVLQSLQILRGTFILAGCAAILLHFSRLAAAGIALAAIPVFISEARYSDRGFRKKRRRAAALRLLSYYDYLVGNDGWVKEIRLFDLGSLFMRRYRTLAEEHNREDERFETRRFRDSICFSLLSLATFYGCYLAVVLAAVGGGLSLGTLTLYVVAFRQSQNAFQSILGALNGMYEDNLYMSMLFEFLDLPTAPAPRPPPPPRRPELGIRFENVGFRYEGASRWALRGIDLFIPPGQSVALVGENGAGKTTLVKLLTRLYEPTEGGILLDGRDLRDWDPEAVRARTGVLFQDFNQYQFTLRENVGFGSIPHLQDDARIARAIGHGGAAEVVADLTEGLETQIGRWFDKGTELSGGQWQRIALARVFMREEADILVLDEPTAALDAVVEQAVFERFCALSRGRTSIIISHRFPTVRTADRIIVFQHGRIVEQGSHRELLDLGSLYARLFNLQAAGYR